MQPTDDFTFFFGAASGQSRAALKRIEEPHVMINYATQNNEPWDGIDRLFIDSGGYSFMKGKGEYTTTDETYLQWLSEREPDVWALRDYPCEPDVLDEHDRTVRDHQDRTLERHISLLNKRDNYSVGGEPVSVLQGWDVDDYFRAIDQYRDHGVLTDYVGVGSVCRRHAQGEIQTVLTTIRDALPDRCRMHAFGVKTSVLKSRRVRELLASADSLAYDYAAQSNVAARLSTRSMQWRDTAREALKMRFRIEELFDRAERDAAQSDVTAFAADTPP